MGDAYSSKGRFFGWWKRKTYQLGSSPNSQPMIAEKEYRLIEWFNANQSRQFEWGRFDCSLAAADWIKHITGKHPCPELIGSYRSSEEAQVLINNAGGHIELVTQFLGNPIDGIAYENCDVVMVEFGSSCFLAVAYYDQLFAAGSRGLRAMVKTRGKIKAAWRVQT